MIKRRLGPAPVLAPVLALGLLSACATTDNDAGDPVQPHFEADYSESFVEVRDCRGSGDHNLSNIRVLANPAALEPYEGRVDPFPVDAILLKEEYDFGDVFCTGSITQWTVMRRLADGSSPDTLDWSWQRVDLSRTVLEADGSACVGCHQSCGVEPIGYGWTCAIP